MGNSHQKDEQATLDVVNVYQQAGQEFMKHQCFIKATQYFQKALDSLDGECRGSTQRTGKVYYDLGRSFQAQGITEEALSNYRKALKIFESEKCDEEIPNLHGSMAVVFASNNQYKKALKSYEHGLLEAKARLGRGHVIIGAFSFQLAKIHMRQDKVKEAIRHLREAVYVYDGVYGVDNVYAADCYNLMGLIMKKKLRYDKAYDCYVRALRIREKNLPKDHVDLATSYSNIGLLLKEQCMFGESLKCLEKCLKIEINKFGSTHQRVVSTLQSLNYVASMIGADMQTALEEFTLPLKIENNKNTKVIRCSRETVWKQFYEENNEDLVSVY